MMQVLAGDPKQLGPCCTGLKSEKFGLGVSLLERLMANFSIYHPNGKYCAVQIFWAHKVYYNHALVSILQFMANMMADLLLN